MKNYELIITAFYKHFNPEKKENIHFLLTKYSGMEEQLMQALFEKYNVSQTDQEKFWLSLSDSEKQNSETKPNEVNSFNTENTDTKKTYSKKYMMMTVGIILLLVFIILLITNSGPNSSKEEITISDSLMYQRRMDSIAASNAATTNNTGNTIEKLINHTMVSASSYMPIAQGISYAPNNVSDNDLNTWWSPSACNSSEWIQLSFSSEKLVSGIEIHGGSHYPSFKNYGDLFPLNSRIISATLEFSDGSIERIEIQDADQIQNISFPVHRSSYLRLYPSAWIDGNKWKDLCISHLVAFEKVSAAN